LTGWFCRHDDSGLQAQRELYSFNPFFDSQEKS
jgi:hypothetical protein